VAEDQSTPLLGIRKQNQQVSTFDLSLGIWCTNTGISRSLYSILLDVMNQLRDDAANKLDHIPKRLGTTKRRVKEQLSLRELRKKPIPLIKEQLPSSIGGEAVPDVPTEDLTFFNPIELFRPTALGTVRLGQSVSNCRRR
jgi:hypothetical protein